jgi:hypothetical protein
MRITSPLIAVVAGLTFAMTGCGGESESQQAPASESVLVEEQLFQGDTSEENVSAMATCPLMWTCNWTTYYGTQSQCTAACGGSPCYKDYACNSSCLCP